MIVEVIDADNGSNASGYVIVAGGGNLWSSIDALQMNSITNSLSCIAHFSPSFTDALREVKRAAMISDLLRLHRTNKYPAWHPPAPSDYHPRSTAHEPPLQPGTTRKIQKGSYLLCCALTIPSEYWHLRPIPPPSHLTSPHPAQIQQGCADAGGIRSRRRARCCCPQALSSAAASADSATSVRLIL
jgi:hypothetical protein